ncbi:hypothetical protein G7054_g14752 [Neopestalotiopsis clavispora]|nr:hypothetical protein G7054_g14752 [Neopestalotiopsis clavispora]
MNDAIALSKIMNEPEKDPSSEWCSDPGLREVKVELDELFSRRYFSRVWILQEIALARSAILLCGEDSIPWLRVVEMASRVIEPQKRPAILDFNRHLCLLPRQELEILDMGRQSRATNARDKVYALLGLLPNRRIGQVEADYTLSVEELYIKVALGLASAYDWSDVLVRAGTHQRVIETLPSWAPDWSFIKPGGPKSYERRELYPSPYPCMDWVQHKQEHQSIMVRAIRCTNHGEFTLIAGEYYENVSWMALRSSYTSASSTYLRFNRNGKLGEMMQKRLRSIRACETQPGAQPSCDESSLILELMRERYRAPNDEGWTLSKASLGAQSHVYVTIEDAIKIFNLTESQVQDGKVGGFGGRPLRDPALSSSTPLEEDLWIQNFHTSQMSQSRDFEDLLVFVDANVTFWRFLVRSFLVRDEWVEIR